jgi:hypothetical protein
MRTRFILAFCACFFQASAYTYDVNDQLSLGGILAGAIQCQDISGANSAGDSCAFTLPFQLETSYQQSPNDQVFFKLGFATGNGINADALNIVAPWAADLKDDLKNINGNGRDHLLTAWYKHTFILGEGRLGATIGIIDATDYLDENAYANDEFTQFMNGSMTNGPNVFLPSYDNGFALQYEYGSWSLHGVWMNVEENDDGRSYDFFGVQAAYSTDNAFGDGNYRLIYTQHSKDFLDPAGTDFKGRHAILLSMDQDFGDTVGIWTRIGKQTDDAAIDYEAIASAGIDLKGSAWGREADNIGIGYSHLQGGNIGIERSRISEGYYRMQFSDVLGITGGIQYHDDDFETGSGPDSWIYSLRFVAEF